MARSFRGPLVVLALILLVVYLLAQNTPSNFGGFFRGSQPIKLSEFKQKVAAKEVSDVTIKGDTYTGTYKSGEQFTFHNPNKESQKALETLMDQNQVRYEYQGQMSEAVLSILSMIMLPLLLIGLFYFFVIRPAQQGSNQALNFGRSRARRMSENVPKVTFEDVAGVDEAKQELAEVVDFLKNTRKYQSVGAKIPKGVLLLGPPGSGKTLLARAIAGEAGVPFFHISGSDFVEMFVGVGAARVRDLFETAKAHRPSLIFIDEIDAVGRLRGAGLGGGHDEREQTLNQLLVEMDGFDPNSGVILIAATNRPDVLDPALLRPGRFDRQIVVDAPDANGRLGILKVHLKGKPLSDDVDAVKISKRTPGFTGADLANLVNESALLAARRDKTKIGMAEFEEAMDRVIAGPQRRSRVFDEREKQVIAYHEVGHAIVGELLPHSHPVHKVTILPRGMALGLTIMLPEKDRYLASRSELLDSITGLLGGRVAEELVFQEVTTGAQNDLQRATDIARAMVCEYGMSEKLGTLSLGRRHNNPFLGRDYMEDRNYSEEVAAEIDAEVRQIIDNCHQRAVEILSANRDKMDEIVQDLLVKETIDRDEFLVLMKGAKQVVNTGDDPTDSTLPGLPIEEKPQPKPNPSPRLEPGPA